MSAFLGIFTFSFCPGTFGFPNVIISPIDLSRGILTDTFIIFLLLCFFGSSSDVISLIILTHALYLLLYSLRNFTAFSFSFDISGDFFFSFGVDPGVFAFGSFLGSLSDEAAGVLLASFFVVSFSAAADSLWFLSGLVALSKTGAVAFFFFFFFLGVVGLSSDFLDFLLFDFLGLPSGVRGSDFLAFPPSFFFKISFLPPPSLAFFTSFFLAPGAANLALTFFFLTVLDLASFDFSDFFNHTSDFLLYARFFFASFLAGEMAISL
mmetsp:Transcript_53342/g.113317  ORF Transcript_53342/g.113317 Transcript_53342/m.113317 type:complete len:265 (-) Transcript_53342:1365-2159(-)